MVRIGKCFLSFLMLMISTWLGAQSNKLESLLFELPDVSFKKLETPKGYEAAYELMVRQPLDHKNPEGKSFHQKVYLAHRSFEAPTVMITEGYDRPAHRIYELTDLMAGNQVQVEHRYFGKSMPDSLNYTYLTLEQATADLHKVNQLLRSLYAKDWISTGISKGGQTTLFYRYFYPNDVDASVPYVAPLNTELEDRRIYTFLDTVGSDECRDKIFNVQKRLLQNREECLQKLKWFSKGAEKSFTYLSMEEAFEYAVLEYSFSFWQWGSSCNELPDEKVSMDSLFSHFLKVSDPGFFSDQDIAKFASHYYQAGTQMGYYGYDVTKFKKWMRALPTSKNPSAIFMPGKLPISFTPEFTQAVSQWVGNHGDRFIYINGNSDTWSATAVRPKAGRDALWYFLPGKDHGMARIKNLSADEKSHIQATLKRWLAEVE